MTQEEKELLLKDLCGRVLYSPTVHIEGDWFDDDRESYDAVLTLEKLLDFKTHDYILKPYLRPMSSITEEEKNELNKRFYNIGYFFTQEPPYDYGLMVQHSDIGSIIVSEFSEVYDWLNAHHFDYRWLIPMGLALEADEGMYKTE